MAWEWSHTAEAYANCRANVLSKPRDWLLTVYAEWRTHEQQGDGIGTDTGWLADYDAQRLKAESLPDDVLGDYIWDQMEAQHVCTNGGHEAWGCPYACGCHQVPFDLEPTPS